MRFFRPKDVPPEIERAREVVEEAEQAQQAAAEAVKKYWAARNRALVEVRRLDTRRR